MPFWRLRKAFAQVARYDDPSEAEPGRFADALFAAGSGTYFSGQADLSGETGFPVYRPVEIRRQDGRDDAHVEPRVADLEPSAKFKKDVFLVHFQADPFFEYGQQHVQPPRSRTRSPSAAARRRQPC